MRAVLQRVKSAQVVTSGRTAGTIGSGLLVFLGVSREDNNEDAAYLVEKTIHLRIFEDEQGKMNLSLLDTGGAMLVVSQFTLLADCRKGRRPSFVGAADPEKAHSLYGYFIEQVEKRGISVATGEFQALMEVSLVNHGPVTVLLDSRKVF
jgi:D-tyrosyl-tRNA(Tyr) deacylase